MINLILIYQPLTSSLFFDGYSSHIRSLRRNSFKLYSALDLSVIEGCLRDDNGAPIPFLNPHIIDKVHSNPDEYASIVELDDNIVIEDDIISLLGSQNYLTMIDVWTNNTMVELPEPVFAINRISKMEDDRVIVQWNVTYIPDAVEGIVSIGRAVPFWKVEFFNILDRASYTSSFSWMGLFKFLELLVFTGVMRLPHAVIQGTTEMKFRNIDSPYEDALEESRDSYTSDSSTVISEEKKRILPKIWRLVSHKESLALVQLMKRGSLKNRKLATDILEFVDTRRPPNYGLMHWNDAIAEKIPFRSVPGMRQLDIDGIEAEEQEKLLSLSSSFMGFVTGVVILCGVGLSSVVMDKVFIKQDQNVGMQKTFANKVHNYVQGEYEDVYNSAY